MRFRTWECFMTLLLIATAIGTTATTTAARFTSSASAEHIVFITPEDLKAKLTKGEAVTIIDVRSSTDVANSDSKIKGAIHLKLRRLRSRLTMPPLNSVGRDSTVVVYCACPNDEASIRAAEMLLESGFKRVYALRGGWVAWKKSGGQIEARAGG